MSARAAALLLFVATLALYLRVYSHGFVHFDDNRYLTENPIVQRGLTWAGLAWAFTTLHASNWHPLTWLSHMLDVQLFGMRPGPHHLVSAVIHALNAALLLAVLSRMTGALGRSAVVAALFAVHPLHVESVAWVAERKDVLSTLFAFLALWAYARYTDRPSVRRYAAVALLFAASLLAKPMWVTFPVLLLLLDVWPLDRSPIPTEGAARARVEQGSPRTWGSLVAEKVPLLLLSVASSATTLVAQHRGGALSGLDLSAGARVANAATSYLRYVGKAFWPSSLSVFYPFDERLPVWTAVAAGVIVAAVTVLAISTARRFPWFLVGWGWFAGMLVPVIGVIQVGGQSLADRYTYAPIIGLFIAVVWAVHAIAAAWGMRIPVTALAAIVLVVLSGLSWRQVAHWSSHEALFRHALEIDPGNGVAHGALSEGLRGEGRLDEALFQAREAVRVDPGSVRHWNNLGVSSREMGLLTEAKGAFEAALRLDPRHASSWINLGSLEMDLGDVRAAEAAFREGARLAPGYAEPWFRLGLLRARAGDLEEAARCYEQAVARSPEHFGAWTNLAVLYQGAGRMREAGEAFEAATRADPMSFVGWRNLGVFLNKTANPAGAVSAFRQALRLRPNDRDLLRRLALADLAVGSREEALSIATAIEAADPSSAAEIRARAAGR